MTEIKNKFGKCYLCPTV